MLKELLKLRSTKADAKRKWDGCMQGVAIDGYVTCQVYGKAIREVLTEEAYALWDYEHIKKMLLTYADRLIEEGDKNEKIFDELMSHCRELD